MGSGSHTLVPPFKKIEFFIWPPSPSPKLATPPPPSPVAEVPPEPEVVGFSCFIACENMGVNLKFHVTNIFLHLHAFENLGGG